MDRLQSMRVFVQIVEQGGFAAAARKLDVAPAAVTRLIGDLEHHLGVRLLQRTTRRLSLTQAGEAYLERVRQILGDIDDAEDMLKAQNQDMGGALRMLAPPTIATHLLGPVVAGFQQLHPRVTIEVQVEDSMEPAVQDYDLAIVLGTVNIDPDVIVRPLIGSHAIICAAPGYLRRHGEPAAPEDLAGHRFLRLRKPGVRLGPLQVVSPEEEGRAVELQVPVVVTSNDTDMLLRATVEGAGISSQPLGLVAPLLRTGQLKRVLAPWITSRPTLVAALPSRKFVPRRTRAFLDHLVAYCQETAAGMEAGLAGANQRLM